MQKTKEVFYLGVEGGATKSTAILCDAEDHIIAQQTGNALSYQNLGQRKASQNLQDLMQPLLKKSQKGTIQAVFGLAGFNSKNDEIIYNRIIKEILPKGSPFHAINDAKIALEAECPNEQNSILVISGTGSNVFGESGKKQTRSIGWDTIFGDEGSGYSIGLRTLKAAMRSFDGRGDKTILEKLVLQKIGAARMDEASGIAYKTIETNKISMKAYTASFAPLVDIALQKNDKIAATIRKATVEELVEGVDAVVRNLNMQQKDFCLGFMGSAWNMPGMKNMFKKALKLKYKRIRFSSKQTASGVWGAISLAKRLK